MSKYINIWDYENDDYPIQIFIGGRGCGKTYSALHGLITDNKVSYGKQFLLMRRTQTEVELMADSQGKEGANPFKPINTDCYSNVGITSINKNMYGIYNRVLGDNNQFIYDGQPLGYCVALSTISKIRGLSFADVEYWIYDEFIAESHVNKLRNEGDAFLNAIETVNRNRELEGFKPVKIFLLANSNNIYNPIFTTLGIVTDVERMVRREQEHKYYKERGLAVHMLKNTVEFEESKKNTMLYKLTSGTEFEEMALYNKFSYNDFDDIEYRKLVDYEPVCSMGKAFIYKRKGKQEFYVSYAPAKCRRFNYPNEIDRKSFMQRIGFIIFECSMHHLIKYESYELKQIILDSIGIN